MKDRCRNSAKLKPIYSLCRYILAMFPPIDAVILKSPSLCTYGSPAYMDSQNVGRIAASVATY